MSYFGTGEYLSVLEVFVCSGAGSWALATREPDFINKQRAGEAAW